MGISNLGLSSGLKLAHGLFCGIALLSASCAQQKVMVKTDAQPFKDLNQLSSLPQSSAPLKITAVKDLRNKGFAVGEALTGARFKSTPVFTEEKPEEFIQSYFIKGLKERGALIVAQDQAIDLQVEVNELWVEEVIEKFQPERARCKASFEFIGKSSAEEFRSKVWTEVTSPGDMGSATEKLGPTLASCMNSVIEKLVKDKKFREFIKPKTLIQ